MPEYDVFISYAHLDDIPMMEEEKGWVAFLHRTLKIRLAQLLGKAPDIWRDRELGGSDSFDDKIIGTIVESITMLLVLSPPYIESKWCMKEMQAFIKGAKQNGGLFINGASRIFKVLKTPIEAEDHPVEINGILGYRFFEYDQASRAPRELSPNYDAKRKAKYFDKVNDLAYDMHKLLKEIKSGYKRDGGAGRPAGASVYLAETSKDLDDQRDQIRRELVTRGYNVLPDRHLPLLGSKFNSMVREILKDCLISIHPIGGLYGVAPEGADRSIVETQLKLADEHGREKTDFNRLIWVPDHINPDERQRKVIDRLKNDPDLPEKDDLLVTTLSRLKTVINDKLEEITNRYSRSTPHDRIYIYLIYDSIDEKNICELADYIHEQGFETLHPLFEGDESEIREEHFENLKIGRGTLIYHGDADESWLRGKIRNLRKSDVLGRTAPSQTRAIYVAGPKTLRKIKFQTHEVVHVIKNFKRFSPDDLIGFLDHVKGGRD